MTAPGQEPDEVLSSVPGGDEETARQRRTGEERAKEPDRGAIGDNHMPTDLREEARDDAAEGVRGKDPVLEDAQRQREHDNQEDAVAERRVGDSGDRQDPGDAAD